jgi:small subunit ribosomal protein S18
MEGSQRRQGRSSGGSGDRRGSRGSSRGRRYGRFARRKRCAFCEHKTTVIDYKDTNLLRRFVTDQGKIRPRRRTGTCMRHQRRLATAIKRARHLALLPFVAELQRSR